MTEHHLTISVPVNSLTVMALLELQHGLHVQIKHTLTAFDRGEVDAITTKARLQDIADTNKSLLETYINHQEESRMKEPF